MPHLRSPTPSEARPHRRTKPPVARDALVLALATGAFRVSLLLVAPVLLWVYFVDLRVIGTLAVAAGAILLSWGVVRRVTYRYAQRRFPAQTAAPLAASPSTCRPQSRHGTPAAQQRRALAANSCGHSRCHPLFVSRSARDAGCSAATRRLARRTARRRTRP